MLQIDHVYEFLYQEIFRHFEFHHCPGGVVKTENIDVTDISVFNPDPPSRFKIFFYDQEPFLPQLASKYLARFDWQKNHSVDEILALLKGKISDLDLETLRLDPGYIHKKAILVTSEHSQDVDRTDFYKLYYFFHGFAALDWYRGYYALNYTKQVNQQYTKDFISYNRIISNDRSYRIYFVSRLVELGLVSQGLVSFGVTDNDTSQWQDEVVSSETKLSEPAKLHIEQHLTGIGKLVIDSAEVHGSASANILRTIPGHWPNNDQPDADAFWHIVTETVFYYDKLHLTEKIFKPIVSKQPFMLLAAPGNLAYLKSYGFKTFEGIIDESYDAIQDPFARIDAVVEQLQWYCNLSQEEKQEIIKKIEPIVEYNFHYFYGEFKNVITDELLTNCQRVFAEVGYDDSGIDYTVVEHILTRE